MTDNPTIGPGTLISDRYELTEIIGRGGFGMVYKGRQINMDRDVAIKILPPEFMSVNDVVQRFKREAKLASKLRHPNTITLHDYGAQANFLYIVMELLDGEDLADLLKHEGRLPLDRIMHIARGILKSLSEAHEHGIVHRDLKPENIFLSVVGDDRDHIKVLDFGIAKLALPEMPGLGEDSEISRKLTLTGSTVGTPAYMSPEQAAGEQVNGQTDLYALGVMMYEMAVGRPPFHDDDAVKVMRAHLFEPVPRMKDTSLHDTVFERVIMKALKKERGERFKTAGEMLLALAGEPVARPLIQGVQLSPVRARADSEPQATTGDFEADTSNSTLSFVKSQDASGDIPFDGTESKPSKETANVASKTFDGDQPPPGFDRREAKISSILQVIEPKEDDDVILLTKPKSTESAETPIVASASASQQRPVVHTDDYKAQTSNDSGQAPLATQPQQLGDGASEWSWGLDVDQSGELSSEDRRGWIFFIIAMLIVLSMAAFATRSYWMR